MSEISPVFEKCDAMDRSGEINRMARGGVVCEGWFMARDMKCGKCGGAMQVGFILEAGESGRPVGKWIEGTPERPWTRFGVKINDRAQYTIETYRCEVCGFLESYARGEGAAQ